MKDMPEWCELQIGAYRMEELLESLASLNHLPYITVENPKVRKIPEALKNHGDFYSDGDVSRPKIHAEITTKNSTSGEAFFDDLPTMAIADVQIIP
jgi:hypothetical protein